MLGFLAFGGIPPPRRLLRIPVVPSRDAFFFLLACCSPTNSSKAFADALAASGTSVGFDGAGVGVRVFDVADTAGCGAFRAAKDARGASAKISRICSTVSTLAEC